MNTVQPSLALNLKETGWDIKTAGVKPLLCGLRTDQMTLNMKTCYLKSLTAVFNTHRTS